SGTAHARQNIRGDMLQRNVAIRYEALLASHQLEKRPVERSGICIQIANPFEAGLAQQCLDESRQSVSDADFFAVPRRVLRDEIQFFHARKLKLLRFAKERFDRARAELPAHLRNRAERTRI